MMIKLAKSKVMMPHFLIGPEATEEQNTQSFKHNKESDRNIMITYVVVTSQDPAEPNKVVLIL
jgi:hypothetical protein